MKVSFLPTRRTAIVGLILAAAVCLYPGDLGSSLWVALAVLNACLLVVVIVDLALAGGSSLIVTREHPPVLTMESTASWAITVSNPGNRSIRVGVADALPPSFQLAPTTGTARLGPRSNATLTFMVRPERRGRFELGSLSMRTTGPLGLAYRQYRKNMPSVVAVHPLFRSKDEAELRVRRAKFLDIGQRSVRGAGAGTDFEQLREYTPDDEYRRVDWAASARTGKTIVRTYRPERNQNVIVMLDNGRLMAALAGDIPRLEHGIDSVLMLTTVGTALGDKVGLVTFDKEVRSTLAPRRNKSQVGRAADAMYQLEPVLAESDYAAAFAHTSARFRKRSLLVLLTELSPQVFDSSVMKSLPLLMRHHIVMVGSVRDPEVDSWAHAESDEASALYRRAAAIVSLNERDRLIARLKGLGIEVVDSVPGRLAPDLADAYLHLKSTGKL